MNRLQWNVLELLIMGQGIDETLVMLRITDLGVSCSMWGTELLS